MTTVRDWTIAIDFGTTSTAAATRSADGLVELLHFDGAPRMSSMVVVQPDGTLLTGRAAENVARHDPARAVPTPKRVIGDRTILVSGQPVSGIRAGAAVLRAVLDEARRQRGGTPPREVVLTHPARWAAPRLDALGQAAADAGIATPTMLAEPVAAAVHFLETTERRIQPGERVAVYDLGGGTFDAAVLRRTDAGGFEVIATGGNDQLGGEDFDERVYQHLGGTLAERRPDAWDRLRHSEERAWIAANADFRRDVRRLKEDLSTATTQALYLRPPVDAELQLTRHELETLVRPDVEQTLDALARTLLEAETRADELAAIYLVGGSSRLRLLESMVRERFGRADTRDDPKAVVALGAARAARLSTGQQTDPTDAPPTGTSPAREPVRAPVGATPPPELAATVAAANPCPVCGTERPEGTTICQACGAGGAPAAPARRWPWLVGLLAAGAGMLLVVAVLVGRSDPEPTASPSAAGGTTAWNDLVEGDCYVVAATDVSGVPCEELHDREVFAVLDFVAAAGDPYPVDIDTTAEAECMPYFAPYVGIGYAESIFYIDVLVPDEAAWQAGSRRLVCALYDQEGQMSGTKRGSGE
jgi:actin-like ATPase involved in cell morphogenesis